MTTDEFFYGASDQRRGEDALDRAKALLPDLEAMQKVPFREGDSRTAAWIFLCTCLAFLVVHFALRTLPARRGNSDTPGLIR